MQAVRAIYAGSAIIVAIGLAGCSLRQSAAGKVGDLLTTGGSGWNSEEDPELVREALPFALKLMESLAAEAPRHEGLRLGLCRGFASYAAGFLEPEAERIEAVEFERARALRGRAGKLHMRARSYCLAALELREAGAGVGLTRDPDPVLARRTPSDVELLYWTGVSWGSAVSLALDRPERVVELPTVRAIFERALALDPAFDRGSLHEAMIVFDSMPAMMGGSFERAKSHFDRAVAFSEGKRASPFVTWARSSAIARQDRREFREVLERAIAIDPDALPSDRMINLISQARARTLLAHADDYFFAEETSAAP